MAFQSVWYYTNIPKKIIDIIEEDLSENFDSSVSDSLLYNGVLNPKRRKSRNAWVPSSHWIGGFLWHYIQRANRENFLYDITNIDGESIQYTHYGVGEFYGWHQDAGLSAVYKPQYDGNGCNFELKKQDFVIENCDSVRKISFVLQLSDPEDYEGGNLQLLDEEMRSYIAPRQRGTLIIFDSRTQHRVLKVTKGLRKSVVGWVVGPRWR